MALSRCGYSRENGSLGKTPFEFAPERVVIPYPAGRPLKEGVAATDLRQRFEAGDPCPDLLPADVSHYILTHHLYGQPRPL